MGWGVRGGEEEDREGDGEKEWTPQVLKSLVSPDDCSFPWLSYRT